MQGRGLLAGKLRLTEGRARSRPCMAGEISLLSRPVNEPAKEQLEALAFCHPWRPYQQRVLEAARLHLADRRLHVVSAPGSGKTTLGLEMFRQLGEPALVLAPTRIIRDQWIEKLREFLPAGAPNPPPWTSRSLDDLRLFTSITYQALHTRTRVSDEDNAGEAEAQEGERAGGTAPDTSEIAAVVESLKRAGVRTLILDEAHHLRAEWWKALRLIVDAIEDLQVISLTATPPYDALGSEWARYEELCGSIDEEISVPELVKAGTLCPHQDFLWTVVPSERESEFIAQHALAVTEVLSGLMADEDFKGAIRAHPWLGASPDADSVLDDPETALALLVFLKAKGVDLSPPLMSLLDLTRDDVPAMGLQWWQRLLHAWLFDSPPHGEAPEIRELRRRVATKLRDRGLLHQRRLELVQSRLAKRYMTQSAAKTAACAEIHAHERRVRGDSLRQVILADFIRDDHAQGVLGAWPIYCAIVRAQRDGDGHDCAMVTGRRVVVHASLRDRLGELGRALRDDPELAGFMRCDSPGAGWVARLTELLELGTLRCLVGTRALLGEGWDAPCINSLILASSVGAYVLTNQMRGRAIRIDRRDGEKVASIWHIVAVVLDRRNIWQQFLLPAQPTLFWPGLADVRELEHRFETFVGVDHSKGVIENNVMRLELPFMRRRIDPVTGAAVFELRPECFVDAAALNRNNHEMVRRLENLATVRESWREAVDQARIGRVVPALKVDVAPRLPGFYWDQTLYSLLLSAAGLAMLGAVLAAKVHGPLWLLVALPALFAAPKLLKAGWLWLRHLPIDGSLQQIGLALRDALCATRIIETSSRRLKVISRSDDTGGATISLEGGTYHEQSLFADCLREIVGPVENPRYLIVRSDGRFRTQRKDYHAVPMRLGARKEDAQLFLQAWLKRVGPAELVYTRSSEHRPMLLRARARAFSNAMQRVSPRRVDRWQ